MWHACRAAECVANNHNEIRTSVVHASLNARYYNSSRGQFISEDPTFLGIRQNLGDPQSLNAYSYANDNPIIKKDPDGKFAGSAAIGIGLIPLEGAEVLSGPIGWGALANSSGRRLAHIRAPGTWSAGAAASPAHSGTAASRKRPHREPPRPPAPLGCRMRQRPSRPPVHYELQVLPTVAAPAERLREHS
jgi:RHS repeat-associated protein